MQNVRNETINSVINIITKDKDEQLVVMSIKPN